MARNKSGHEQAVTLFPFLAVLICVMGALIFLLLATTKRMRDLAVIERMADVAPSASLPDLLPGANEGSPLPITDLGAPRVSDEVTSDPAQKDREAQAARDADEMRQRITELEQRRALLQADLQRQRQLQEAAQRHVDDLQDSVRSAETKLRGALAELKSAESGDEFNHEIGTLEAKIIDLRRKLRQLKNRPAEGESKFAVVPFDVRSGTTRRPILIECTDAGLRFLPENVVVRPSDLEGFTERYNPLAAGAAALVNYWSEQDRRQPQPEREPEPYVLLIVRPSGTVGYYVAMKMLAGLKQPFGYELIDDGVELQLPPVDPQAQQICQSAVAERIAERDQIAQRVQGTFRRGRGASSDSFEVADVIPAEQTIGDESWQNIDRFEGRRLNEKSSPANGPVRPTKTTATRPATLTTPSPPSGSPISNSAQTRHARPRELDDAPLESPRAPRSPNRDDGNLSPQSTVRLEHLSRRKWGDSDGSATIGVEKDVTIRVDSQKIVIADERVIHQHPGERSLDLFLRVMEAVDGESRTWGKPRPGFYWTPRLRFVISPGGNQVFERIDPHAMRSGLATTREFTLEAAAPAATEGLR